MHNNDVHVIQLDEHIAVNSPKNTIVCQNLEAINYMLT